MNKTLPLILLLFAQVCSATTPEDLTKFTSSLIRRMQEKESYSQNDLMAILLLQELSSAQTSIIIATRNQITPETLPLITGHLTTAYTLAITEDLELTQDETDLVKSFIKQSGKFLSENLNKLTANPRLKRVHKLPYEFLLKAAEKYSYKAEESKKLLERYNKK